MKRFARTVAALTLAVGGLTTSLALAQTPPPPPAEPPPQTPLAVRPSKPIELAAEHGSSRFTAIIAASIVALGGAVWLIRRRDANKAGLPRRKISISARQAIGVRSELLVVEVDGQGILLGVTPGAIQRIAVLPNVEEDARVRADEHDIEPGFRVDAAPAYAPPPAPAHNMDSLLPDTRPEPRPEMRRAAITLGSERRVTGPRRDLPVEEQVRGLVRARRAQ